MRVSSVSQNIFENVNQNRNKKAVVPAIDTEEKQQTGTQNTVENISKVSVYNTNSDLIKAKMISQGEEAQKQTALSCYYQLAEMFPELSFRFTDGVDENGNPKLYGTGYFCKGQADSDQNSGCVINVDKKVIDSMQENKAYADRVKSILSNAEKVTNGFITNCEEHAKELLQESSLPVSRLPALDFVVDRRVHSGRVPKSQASNRLRLPLFCWIVTSYRRLAVGNERNPPLHAQIWAEPPSTLYRKSADSYIGIDCQ